MYRSVKLFGGRRLGKAQCTHHLSNLRRTRDQDLEFTQAFPKVTLTPYIYIKTIYKITKFRIGMPCACTEYLLFTPTPVALSKTPQVSSPPPTITIGIGFLLGSPLPIICISSNNGRIRNPGGNPGSSSKLTTTTNFKDFAEGAKEGILRSFWSKLQPPRLRIRISVVFGTWGRRVWGEQFSECRWMVP